MKKTIKDLNGSVMGIIDDRIANNSNIYIERYEEEDKYGKSEEYHIGLNDKYGEFCLNINDVMTVHNVVSLNLESSKPVNDSNVYNCISADRTECITADGTHYVEAIFDMNLNDNIVYVDIRNDNSSITDINITTYDKSKMEELLK